MSRSTPCVGAESSSAGDGDDRVTAALPLLGGPFFAAVVLAVAGRRPSRGIRAGVTLAGLALTLAGLAWGVLDWTVAGRAVRVQIDLGQIDPTAPVGRLAWSLAIAWLSLLASHTARAVTRRHAMRPGRRDQTPNTRLTSARPAMRASMSSRVV